ncbi:hypothetical protein HELRODRAFT_73717, partial [Helobdella robusta]|uniref:U2A'/phosphoprotein 32 family A C-terminal domain-containing protein n=1 Tax=Helobdella robusta TaxID=6412 RepID=T1G1H6_HELRO
YVGVRYITEDLLKKLVGTISLEYVTTLNLTLAKPGGKFKYIENLEKLKRLENLNLSKNNIEKIDRLSHLTRLKELNISDNCLTRIENLQPLTNLQVLDLSHNKIKTIPSWLPTKLIQLRSFNVAENNIADMTEFVKFRDSIHLTTLKVSGNPFTDISTYRLFLLYHLRTVEWLDGCEVSEDERTSSQQRFGQGIYVLNKILL